MNRTDYFWNEPRGSVDEKVKNKSKFIELIKQQKKIENIKRDSQENRGE